MVKEVGGSGEGRFGASRAIPFALETFGSDHFFAPFDAPHNEAGSWALQYHSLRRRVDVCNVFNHVRRPQKGGWFLVRRKCVFIQRPDVDLRHFALWVCLKDQPHPAKDPLNCEPARGTTIRTIHNSGVALPTWKEQTYLRSSTRSSSQSLLMWQPQSGMEV